VQNFVVVPLTEPEPTPNRHFAQATSGSTASRKNVFKKVDVGTFICLEKLCTKMCGLNLNGPDSCEENYFARSMQGSIASR